MQYFRRGKRIHQEFLADSAEQIAESMDKANLRDKIDQAFTAAIARVGGHLQRSFGPDVNETREVDATNH